MQTYFSPDDGSAVLAWRQDGSLSITPHGVQSLQLPLQTLPPSVGLHRETAQKRPPLSTNCVQGSPCTNVPQTSKQPCEVNVIIVSMLQRRKLRGEDSEDPFLTDHHSSWV